MTRHGRYLKAMARAGTYVERIAIAKALVITLAAEEWGVMFIEPHALDQAARALNNYWFFAERFEQAVR